MKTVENNQSGLEMVNKEIIQNGQYSVRSQFDPDFDISKFISLQVEGLHPGFAEKLPELCRGIFTFDNENPSLLAFNLLKDGDVVGVAYGFARDLTDYKIIEVKDGEAIVRPLAELIRENFPEIGERIYTLDLGGAYIKPSERGKGAYSILFKERLEQISEWVSTGKIIFSDASGNEIPSSQVLFGISNVGKLSGHSGLQTFVNDGFATTEALSQLGINIEDFGIPRDESAAVTNHVKKHYSEGSLVNFIHVANGKNHGGPIYAARIPRLD